jgi:hypothetical protein
MRLKRNCVDALRNRGNAYYVRSEYDRAEPSRITTRSASANRTFMSRGLSIARLQLSPPMRARLNRRATVPAPQAPGLTVTVKCTRQILPRASGREIRSQLVLGPSVWV